MGSAGDTSILSTRSPGTLCTRQLSFLGILDALTNESRDGLEGFNAIFEGLHGSPKSPGPNCARLCLPHPLLDHALDIREIFDQSRTRYKHLLMLLAMLEFPVYSLQAKREWPMWFSGPAPG